MYHESWCKVVVKDSYPSDQHSQESFTLKHEVAKIPKVRLQKQNIYAISPRAGDSYLLHRASLLLSTRCNPAFIFAGSINLAIMLKQWTINLHQGLTPMFTDKNVIEKPQEFPQPPTG